MIVKPTRPTYAQHRAALKSQVKTAKLNIKLITHNPYRLSNALTALCWIICGLVLLAAAIYWPDYYSPGGAAGMCCSAAGMFWMAAEWLGRR